MLDVKEIAYNKDGITYVLKLPFTLTYEDMDKEATITKQQAERIMVDVLDFIRTNCEIRRKCIRQRKDRSAKKGKK